LQAVQAIATPCQMVFPCRRMTAVLAVSAPNVTGVMKVSATVFAPGETAGAAELAQAGLLLLGEQVTIDATAVFVPADAEGIRRIEIGSGARVGAYSLIYGDACIGENARVEEHTIVGKPAARCMPPPPPQPSPAGTAAGR